MILLFELIWGNADDSSSVYSHHGVEEGCVMLLSSTSKFGGNFGEVSGAGAYLIV